MSISAINFKNAQFVFSHFKKRPSSSIVTIRYHHEHSKFYYSNFIHRFSDVNMIFINVF